MPPKQRITAAHAPKAAAQVAPADPHSTPARRRRIIADVARFLLRQYCVKACKNVAIFRRHTAAALTFQCAFRGMIARRLCHKLRLARWTRCAVAIQLVRRSFIARRELRLRREEAWRRKIHEAAVVLQCWLRQLIASRTVSELRARRRDYACRTIQRVYRGRIARRLYYALFELSQQLRRRRNAAAVCIQCLARVCAARRHVQWRRMHARALRLVHAAVAWWWRRRQRRRLEAHAVATLQRCARGFVARRHVRRLRVVLAEYLRKEERLCRREIQEMSRQDFSAPEPAGTVELRIELPGDLLRHMVNKGPAAVAQWALQQNIFSVASLNDVESRAPLRLCYGDLVRRVLDSLSDATDAGGTEEPRLLSVQRPDPATARDMAALIAAADCRAELVCARKADTETRVDSSIMGRIGAHMAGTEVSSATETKRAERSDLLLSAMSCVDGFSNSWGRLSPFGTDVMTVAKGWEPPEYASVRADRGAGRMALGSSKQCVHRRLHRRVATCQLCRRCRAVNVLNELSPRSGEGRYCSKIKFDNDKLSRCGNAGLRVTIHGLKAIDLYLNKSTVVCHAEPNGKERYFLEEKFILLLAESPSDQGGPEEALDFQVNNSLLKVSFYDRGVQLAPKPPLEVYRDTVDITEDTETDLEEWCVSGLSRRTNRPQTARVMHMLVVEEEVAEIIAYDEKATILQCMVRCRLSRRRLAEERFLHSQRAVICGVLYRMALIRRWREAVRDVLHRAHVSAIDLQRIARGQQGRRRCSSRRTERSLELWDEARKAVQAIVLSSWPLVRFEDTTSTTTARSRYRLLEEYAQTLNLSYYTGANCSSQAAFDTDVEICLRNFVRRQATAGWSADMHSILEAPPPMPGCVSSGQALLLPSDYAMKCDGGTKESSSGGSLMNSMLPLESSSDSSTWCYPSLQRQPWSYRAIQEKLRVEQGQTIASGPLASEASGPDRVTKAASAKALPPAATIKKQSVKKMSEKETATLDEILAESPLNRITQSCIGLGNVTHVRFKPNMNKNDINTVVLNEFSSTVGCIPSTAASVPVRPMSRGSTPPVPPVSTQTHSWSTAPTKNQDAVWNFELNTVMPSMFARL